MFSSKRCLGSAGLALFFAVAASAANQPMSCQEVDSGLESALTRAMSSAQDTTVPPPQLMATLHQIGVRLVVPGGGRADARVEDSLDEVAYRLDRLISAQGSGVPGISHVRGEYIAAIRSLKTAIESQHCTNAAADQALGLLSQSAQEVRSPK